jgi:C4-dicarboxylate-binding protein DctP
VQKHLSLTNHGYLGYATIVNKKFWEGLPPDVRGQLGQAMKEATEYANRIAKDKNDEDLAKVKASGKTEIYTPTKEERLALKKALLPVHKKMESRLGKQLLEDFYKATGFAQNKI